MIDGLIMVSETKKDRERRDEEKVKKRL